MQRQNSSSRCLARAGWSVLSPTVRSPEPGPPKEFNALGAQLVSQVAASWTRTYKFTIMPRGFDGTSAFHYECIFSRPTNELPVPTFIASSRFALVVPSVGSDPKLLYGFEEGDLRHEWALVRDGMGQWRAAMGQQFGSLGDDKFERYLDRVIHEKEKVRDRGVEMTTRFEETRLQKPPAYSEASSEDSGSDVGSKGKDWDDVVAMAANAEINVLGSDGTTIVRSQDEASLVMTEALKAAGLYCDKVSPPSSVAELLASIFDAADEEDVGELPHYEVGQLLIGILPGFGLELWDIHLLLTSAQENDDGFIECKAFVQAAPEIITALRKRRMLYRSRGLPGVEVPPEAVKHCFTEDATVTANQLAKVFEQCTQEDPSCGMWQHRATEDHHHQKRSGTRNSTGGSKAKCSSFDAGEEAQGEEFLAGIKRRLCHDCVASLPERLSPQETMRLMQMLPEDDMGFTMVDDMIEHLEHLRTDAMLNALVESDVLSLRTHLVLQFRRLGLGEDGKMRLWVIKDALLQADQICLSRSQIHVLTCLATADSFGFVNVAEFLGICCVVIPHMFNAKLFVDTAKRLVEEHAESMKRAENAEIAALGARASISIDADDIQEIVEVNAETVEKTLQQILTLNDDARRSPPSLPPETIYNILAVNEKEVQGTQLTTFEITGFASEMQADENGLVPYVDHIKRWVPMIFELRKNHLLSRYLEEDFCETLGIERPDLAQLEKMFPMLPYTGHVPKGRNSTSRRSSRAREHRDSFAGEHKSQASHAPSHSKDSKGMRSERTDSKSNTHRRMSSKRFVRGAGGVEKQEKEPPPGRGYARRKARIDLAAAEGLAAAPTAA